MFLKNTLNNFSDKIKPLGIRSFQIIKKWRLALIAGIISFVLCFAVMAAFFSRNYTVGVLKSKFGEFERNLQAMGYDYAYDDLRFYSFSPWQIMRAKNFRIYSLDEDNYWQWKTEELNLDVGLWNMDKIDVYMGRQQVFQYADKKWTMQFKEANMQFRLKDNRLNELLLKAEEAAIKDLWGIETVYAQVKYQQKPYMAIKVDVKGAQIAPVVDWAMNKRIDHFYINLIQKTPWKEEALLSEAFYDWIEKGGSLDVQKFILNWKPLIMVGTGDIFFSEEGEPTMTLNTASLALPETVEKLNENGIISNKSAFVLKILLNNKAIQQNETDQYKTVVSPLKISKGSVWLENIKIK